MAKKAAKKQKNKATVAQAADPSKTLDAAPTLGDRVLNVLTDAPDLRDRIYEPALLDLALSMGPPEAALSPVRDQGREGACTGFALAGAITLMDRLRHQKQTPPVETKPISPRMLYEMAKINDEWPGEYYEGSSIRGALKGFYNNGACKDDLAPYKDGDRNWYLTVEQARDARNIGLGAYYRLRPEIIDYHAALNEAGVILASAKIHRGWLKPSKGEIKPSHLTEGGHAFIIVGYDQKGFLVQNSWGENWGRLNGRPGIARWSYADWAATIMDAWVLRLSVPTPDAFDLTVAATQPETDPLFEAQSLREPRHEDIVGHVIHLNDGKLVETGKHPTPITTIRETANFLADETATAERGYKHLMFYAHGGLNNLSASANRVRKMKEVFKRNGIYPIHFMWETGFFETLKDVIFSARAKSEARVGSASDFFDRMLEAIARGSGKAIWRDMKWDADQSFRPSGGGRAAVKTLLEGNAKRDKPLNIHLVGHSAGSILLAHLLAAMNRMNPLDIPVKSCSLMAPASTVGLFKDIYHPRVGLAGVAEGVSRLRQYSLIDPRELDDTVGPYGKSLLYLVSNAFEDEKKMPLLGMEISKSKVPSKTGYKTLYAGRAPSATDSKTHGGFDNDRQTMNDILKTILGKKPTPAKGFQPEDMLGY